MYGPSLNRNNMTPNEIEVLIHCHVTPTVHPRANAPAVEDAIQRFLKHGLIEKDDSYYKTTGRGEVHVKQLCSLPWPTKNGSELMEIQ